jgi:hypothetical protein
MTAAGWNWPELTGRVWMGTSPHCQHARGRLDYLMTMDNRSNGEA